MAIYTLTVIDVRDIQGYIFGSNNLRQNVGASELVQRATDDWLRASLPPSNNASNNGKLNGKTIERDGLAAEVIYTGGGNSAILFADHDTAIDFAKKLSRRAVLEAPGLKLFVTHARFEWSNQSLARVMADSLGTGMRQKKNRGETFSPLLGLGVTADCQFTDLPASTLDEEDRRVSAEVLAKTAAARQATERLAAAIDLQRYDTEDDFDRFGTPGQSSYIAVVHADGNGIGKRLIAIADRLGQPDANRRYVEEVRAFSDSVSQAGTAALKSATQLLLGSIDGEGKIGGVAPFRNDKLPFRPIVFGGDDVTFVCDGRLGLWLAERYLREFAAQTLSDGRPASARAGVAVVKTHYPFARAYALASELADSAKRRIRELDCSGEKRVSALDWHFTSTGLMDGLEEIRRREYSASWSKGQPFLMRPLSIGDASDWRSWQVFSAVFRQFTNAGWRERRSKLKTFQSALRGGPDTVRQFIAAPLTLPELPGYSPEGGCIGPYSAYFDAVEALDFFVPLKETEDSR